MQVGWKKHLAIAWGGSVVLAAIIGFVADTAVYPVMVYLLISTNFLSLAYACFGLYLWDVAEAKVEKAVKDLGIEPPTLEGVIIELYKAFKPEIERARARRAMEAVTTADLERAAKEMEADLVAPS